MKPSIADCKISQKFSIYYCFKTIHCWVKSVISCQIARKIEPYSGAALQRDLLQRLNKDMIWMLFLEIYVCQAVQSMIQKLVVRWFVTLGWNQNQTAIKIPFCYKNGLADGLSTGMISDLNQNQPPSWSKLRTWLLKYAFDKQMWETRESEPSILFLICELSGIMKYMRTQGPRWNTYKMW